MNPVRRTNFSEVNIEGVGPLVLISELMQETGSFKFRAAWSVVQNVTAEHFLAASSGNFGQALARAAQLMGKVATIVMPTTSAKVKIDAVRRYGANVVLVDTRVESRADCVQRIHRAHPDYYVASAYDCSHVIAGNASLGVEIARSDIGLDILFVPIGGGGLSSGIITGLCHEGSHLSVWGAEPRMGNDASRSFQSRELCRNDLEPQTIADGARTVSLGKRNWEILKEGLEGVIEVEEQEIMMAMVHLADRGIRVEPTAALSVVAGIKRKIDYPTDRVGCVLSGGNVDDDVYRDLCTQGRSSLFQSEF
jgi:threonine dehydratase